MSRWTHFDWLALRRNPQRSSATRKKGGARSRRLRVEPLEDRRVLATLYVNSLADGFMPGDGLVTLREAIFSANTGAVTDLGAIPDAGFDEIVFDVALDGGTIMLAPPPVGGTLAIMDDLEIDASMLPNGLTIDGGEGLDLLTGTGDGFSVFTVDDLVPGMPFPGPTMTAEFIGLTITGGDAAFGGGGILNAEELTVTDCNITGNAAGGPGGGIFNMDGVLTVIGSRITDNAAGGMGGGIGSAGPAGDVTVILSTIADNMSGGPGGGIAAMGGDLTVTSSTIDGNAAGGPGGGIFKAPTPGAALAVTSSTISGNTSAMDGGGIWVTTDPTSTATIINTTLSGNAAADDGGGIYEFTAAGGFTTIAHSTITLNLADADGDGIGVGGGLAAFGAAGAALPFVSHTIVSGNLAGVPPLGPFPDDVGGAVGILPFFSLIGVPAMLAPLSNNGGPTLTHKLLPGSLAIDAGLLGIAAPPSDQRGGPFLRVDPAAGIIDIGAYELQVLVPVPSLIVDTLVDENDGDYSPGDLSLREAIGLANGNMGFDDEITFAPALSGGTIALDGFLGELDITDDLDIVASDLPGGITIDAGNGADGVIATGDGFRIFNIDDFTPMFIGVELIGVTLTGGDVVGAGGAISSMELLTVTDCVVTGNAATGGAGGGIFGGGPVTIVNGSTISGNTTLGPFAFGGGIGAMGDLVVENSSVVGNSTTGVGSVGGGIWTAGSLLVTGSTIADNTAVFEGGGISTGTGPLTIESSTISANIAGGGGGGIATGVGTFTIDSSTISGNSAVGGGGGILTTVAMGSTSTISHSTITDNTADTDGSGDSGGGIAVAVFFSDLSLDHTIVAANTDVSVGEPDIDVAAVVGAPGSVVLYYSLIGEATSPMIDMGGTIAGAIGAPIDPMLAPLADNGGPTLTHVPLFGSPALNAGDPTMLPIPGEFDQRGAPFLRFDGGQVDIGAYELAFPASLVVDTITDFVDADFGPGELSLREAVLLANLSAGADEITFAPALSGGTIFLDEMLGELPITDDLEIDASDLPGGITIDAGNGADDLAGTGDGMRIFNIDDMLAGPTIAVDLLGLTLTGGDVTAAGGGGGAILSEETLSVTDCVITGNATSGDMAGGGGISNTGMLTVTGSTIAGNSTSGDMAYGGGIFNAGLLTVTGSEISGNSTSGVAGFGGGIAAFGTVAVSDSTISENSVGPASGGGIFVGGSLSVTGSTIADNTAMGDGGGIYVSGPAGSTLAVTSSTISGNVAGGNGGGISGPFMTMTIAIDSSTISGNTAGYYGGGISMGVPIGSPSSISRSTITGNFAGESGGGISVGIIAGRTLPLNHTIVADNSVGIGIGPDLFEPMAGTITSTYSLIGDGTGATVINVGGSSLVGTAAAPIDPMLGALADNGGPTMTHALLPGSSAINAGDPAAVAGAAGVPMLDQRGASWSRVVGGRTDIGAFEYQPLPPAFFGDYNLDGFVDSADYVVLRKTLGTVGVPAYSGADGDGDGTVDDGDRLVWRSNFGAMLPASGSGSAAAESGVPTSSIRESLVTPTSQTNLAAVETDADTLREESFAAFESPASSQKFDQSPHQPIHPLRIGNPINDDLLLLAIDNVGRFRANEVSVVEHCGNEDHLTDGAGHRTVFNDPLELALREW